MDNSEEIERKTRLIEEKLYEITIESLEKICDLFPQIDVKSSQIKGIYESGVEIGFEGPFSGKLILKTYGEISGIIIASIQNREKEYSEEDKKDALKELANVVCGNILPYIAGPRSIFKLYPPTNITSINFLYSDQSYLIKNIIQLESGSLELLLLIRKKKSELLDICEY